MRPSWTSNMLRRAISISLVAVGFGLAAAPALANTPITAYEAIPSTPQAGGHPDLGVLWSVENRLLQHSESACNCEDAKDVTVHLPTGFIGNPHATPQCSLAEFSSDSCPIDSQVGIVHIEATPGIHFNSAVYNLIPPPGDAGLSAFKIFGFETPQFIVLSARTGSDYGLDATSTSLYHGIAPVETFQEDLWGVPADPSHDPLRLNSAFNPNGAGLTAYEGDFCDANGSVSTTADPSTIVKPCVGQASLLPPTASNSPLTPFLQNPTTCDSPFPTSLDVLSYDGSVTHADATWPQGSGCSQLSFNPSLYVQPTTTATDSASGIDVNLTVPQQLSPTIPSPTELRGATVTLPAGFSINANTADGKTACSDAAANFGTTEAANCPEFSKVGSLEIDSSALPGPLPGFVYLGRPLPGNRYRIFLVADGFATHIKLAGTVTPDPVTGQLVITFQNLPQSPLTAFDMHFFGSERGLLATPTRCGTYPVTSTFTPWDSSLAPQTSTQFFSLNEGPDGAPCPGPQRPFSPTFTASSAGNTAGSHTPFSVELTRADGDQNLTGLTVKTPPGLSATLAGIPYCSESAIAQLSLASYSGLAEQASPACPAASQVGTATAGAGAGTHPLYVPGKVYLAGPYKGAPLSLVIVIPAVSGPYDLGNVAVRTALNVDETSAQITAVSDPLPQILEGILLRTRYIRVNLDREGFALNPTNCEPLSVDATAFGDQGAQANLSSHFQVANCAALNFAPQLGLKFSGGTTRAAHPSLKTTITTAGGEANFKTAQVVLPHSELLDNAHINAPCTRVQFAADACPPTSKIGFARAKTPILGAPLEGPVYLRSSPHKLPDLVADLRGQFHIVLDGRVDSVNERIRTTFETLPDAPVSSFTLSLYGGKKGLLINSENLCASPRKAMVRLGGQNGKGTAKNITIETSCGSKARHRRHHHHLIRARAVR